MIEALSFGCPVILLGGGDCDLSLLRRMTAQGWPLVAADGGANRLLDTEINPAAIIGDLDSLQQRSRWESVCPVIQIEEQNTTDFEKCLYQCKAPLFVALGFTGKRFDHTLAALHVLHRYVDSRIVALVSDTDVVVVIRGALYLELPKGIRLSVYPMERVEFSGSTGLLYPLDNLVMQQGQSIGCSNSTNDNAVSIVPLDRGTYSVIVPVAEFNSMTRALIQRGQSG
ncbi:thiamine diphosphokinase [Chromatiales bacterium (ex Bugula neritina AB1)]|nr:thiamine diphosphokinase [Chromatiales bacterium (ex Bugula neritina AB1)]